MIAPLLVPFAWPFGAGGLFVVADLAFAATFLARLRQPRLLRLPGDRALLFALLTSATPVAVHTSQEIV